MDAEMLVAVTGFIVGLGGLALNLRGVRDQNRQQQVATAALDAKGRLDETQQALDALEARAERAEAGEQTWRARAEHLEEELDEDRSLRRHLISSQESRCREVTGELVEALVTLRGVVVDEVARAAAGVALQNVSPHPHALPAAPERLERPDPPPRADTP